MRSAKYKSDFWWGRWEGTIADVAEVARVAERLVADVRNNATVEISVETRIVDTDYVGVDEFESEVSDSEIATIDLIKVHVYDGSETGWIVTVVFAKEWPVVVLHVSGPDRTFVVGAAEQVREAINDRRRRPRFGPEKLGKAAALVVCAALLLVATLAIFRLYPEDSDWVYRILNLLLVIGLLGPIALSTFTWVQGRFPLLELMPSNGRPLAEDVRRQITRLVLALGGLVVAAVVVVLVNEMFSWL